MNLTVAQLTIRSVLGRRRALVLLVLPVLLLALATFGRVALGTDGDLAALIVGGLGLGTMVPLLSLIAGTAVIAPEIEDGSIVYVLSKPLSRSSIVVTKLLVAFGVVVAFGVLPILVAGLLTTGELQGLTIGYAAGAGAAALAYCALFVLLSILTRNAVFLGLVYALLWESLIGQLVPGAQTLSVQQWALSISERIAGDAARFAGVDAAVELRTGAILLVAVALGGTWYAGRRLRTVRITGDS